MRKGLKLSLISRNLYEKMIINIINDNIPVSFIEGFNNNIKEINDSWPKKPRTIFTSHCLNQKTNYSNLYSIKSRRRY